MTTAMGKTFVFIAIVVVIVVERSMGVNLLLCQRSINTAFVTAFDAAFDAVSKAGFKR